MNERTNVLSLPPEYPPDETEWEGDNVVDEDKGQGQDAEDKLEGKEKQAQYAAGTTQAAAARATTTARGAGTQTRAALDRGAGEIIENLAKKAGIACSASWSKNRIAEELLKKVLGDSYVKPKRGASQTVCNHAIINGYLVEHVYENDGCGGSDSIKRAAHIYLKKK